MRKLLAVMHEELKHLSAGALTPTTLLTELSSRHRWDRTALDAQQLKWKSSSERHLAGLQRVVVEETMLQFEALEAQLLLPASFPLRHLEVAAVGLHQSMQLENDAQFRSLHRMGIGLRPAAVLGGEREGALLHLCDVQSSWEERVRRGTRGSRARGSSTTARAASELKRLLEPACRAHVLPNEVCECIHVL